MISERQPDSISGTRFCLLGLALACFLGNPAMAGDLALDAPKVGKSSIEETTVNARDQQAAAVPTAGDARSAEEDVSAAAELSAADQADLASAEPMTMSGPGKQPPASLKPLIELARQAKEQFETKVDAYTCLLVKRETIEGELESTKYIRLKIRERRLDGDRLVRPQCIYGRFLKPDEVAGREILYVENERGGDILVRRGGTRLPNLTIEIDPDGRLARRESNFSIVQTGIRPLVEQILDRMENQIDPNNLQIRYFAGAKVDGRPCQHIEVRELERRADSTYQVAKVYVDEELKLPVFFASYAWSDQPGGAPVLQEQYAITRIDLNAQLSDIDFDRTNPEYKFRNQEDEQESVE